MPETISYPGRDALGIMAAQVDSTPDRSTRAYLARSVRAALDAQAHDLAALARRLDELDDPLAANGPPCAACGEPDAAHLLNPDNAEDWQPQHRYIAPDSDVPAGWPVVALPQDYPDANTLATCGACGRSWDDDIITSMTPAPGGRCPFELFHVEDAPAPALPAWVIESTPCAACPEDLKQEHDDNGWTDDDGDHRGHTYSPEPVHRLAVTFYVAAPEALDAADVAEMLQNALDVARGPIVDALAVECTLIGATDPEPAR